MFILYENEHLINAFIFDGCRHGFMSIFHLSFQLSSRHIMMHCLVPNVRILVAFLKRWQHCERDKMIYKLLTLFGKLMKGIKVIIHCRMYHFS